jgi:hypothetical protein
MMTKMTLTVTMRRDAFIAAAQHNRFVARTHCVFVCECIYVQFIRSAPLRELAWGEIHRDRTRLRSTFTNRSECFSSPGPARREGERGRGFAAARRGERG